MSDDEVSFKSVILLFSLIIVSSMIIFAWNSSNPYNYSAGYKNGTLTSKGISLVIEPSNVKPRDRDYVQFSILIVNDNPYPVRIPVFSPIYMGFSPDEMMPSVFISWIKPYIEIGASSSRLIYKRGYQVRYPVFKLYVSAGGATAFIELEVEQ